MTDEKQDSNTSPEDTLKQIVTGMVSGLNHFRAEVGKAVDALITGVEKALDGMGDPTKPTPTQPAPPPQTGIPTWLPKGVAQTNRCQATASGLHCDAPAGHPAESPIKSENHWIFDQRNGLNQWTRWDNFVA